jgi:hypothetical protein
MVSLERRILRQLTVPRKTSATGWQRAIPTATNTCGRRSIPRAFLTDQMVSAGDIPDGKSPDGRRKATATGWQRAIPTATMTVRHDPVGGVPDGDLVTVRQSGASRLRARTVPRKRPRRPERRPDSLII